MENVMIDNARIYDLREVVALGIIAWGLDTKEGLDFWNALHDNLLATYSELKHLDKSYTPEPAKPPVMWRKIDKDNLPDYEVVATDLNDRLFIGYLFKYNFDIKNQFMLLAGNGAKVIGLTHYIPLSDLLNLPTE
jgi:hypothetical protein